MAAFQAYASSFVTGMLNGLLGESGRETLKESLGPGVRTLGQLASWTKDEDGENIPELALNLTLLAETFLQLFASGLGKLAFIWATVVLLGGFSTMLITLDFWFITAIVFIEAASIVGYNLGVEARFFMDFPAALSQTNKFLRSVISVSNWIAQAPVVAAIACITLSIIRFVAIATHYSGGSSGSNSNLKPALLLFYTLVLTQGALFFLWVYVAWNRWELAKKLKDYFENIDVVNLVNGRKLMNRYVTTTLDTCLEKGVVSTLNRTLVSFAAELLQSEFNGDHIAAISVLYVVIRRKERIAGVVHQICASEKFAGRLFQLIRILDQDNKAHAAEIVSKFACNLRLAGIPEAVPSISSLLDSRLMETAAQTEFPGQNQNVIIGIDRRPKRKPLFLHALLILGELASDTENRREICQATDLVSKILAPVSLGLLQYIGNDSKTIQIVEASLVLVAKLASVETQAGREMCSKISEDKRIAENLIWILQKSDGMKCNGDYKKENLALQILTKLSLGDATERFVGVLVDLVSQAQDSPLRMPTVRALNALAADPDTCQLIIGKEGKRVSLIQQLIDIMRNEANFEYRTATAELLAQICTNSTPGQDSGRLQPVRDTLSMVLHVIVVETTNYAHFVKTLQVIDANITIYTKHCEDLQLQPTLGETSSLAVSVGCNLFKVLAPNTYSAMRAKERDERAKECDEHLKKLHENRDETRIHAKSSWRSIFHFMSLALEICAKLGITTEALTNALATLHMDDHAFARNLMEIVCLAFQTHETYDDGADLACLKTMKTTTKLATRLMRTNHSYIQYFKEGKFIEKLHRGLQATRDLERDMILTGLTTAHETKGYEPLQSVVENARKLVWPQQR